MEEAVHYMHLKKLNYDMPKCKLDFYTFRSSQPILYPL